LRNNFTKEQLNDSEKDIIQEFVNSLIKTRKLKPVICQFMCQSKIRNKLWTAFVGKFIP